MKTNNATTSGRSLDDDRQDIAVAKRSFVQLDLHGADSVKRMIRLAKLPAIKIPARTRPVYRIPLRGFHKWLQDRTTNPEPELRNYETFLADFELIRAPGFRGAEESVPPSHEESD